MPVIILSEPFMRHYAGSLFKVSDAIGVSGWDDDDRVREKQSCYDQRVYFLPDDGKGMSTELPLPYAFDCPENILKNVDLKSGPCRITSVSEGLQKHQDDPWFADPLPIGRGKLFLRDSSVYNKNIVVSEDMENIRPLKATIVNLVTLESKSWTDEVQNSFRMDFSDFYPGFYKIDLMKDTVIHHFFTLIKCYPIYVTFEGHPKMYHTSPTLW